MKTLFNTLLILFLLSACNRTPKDDGSIPPPLYPQPQSVKLDTSKGYTHNQLTGDPIEPLVNSLGDTIPTGVPIPVKGKVIHPDSVAKPKVVKAGKGKVTNAHPNRHKVPDDLTTIPVNLDSLTKIPLEKIAEDDTSHYIVNSIGDTIPTGVPIPAKGKVVKAIQPKPIKALPPAFKDVSTANLQYLDVDQGMVSSYVYCAIKDSKENLWFGTNGGGLSRYDGDSFTHFTEREGLSKNIVRSLLEDSKGNIWVGTWGGGVSCYDGENFTHFTEKEGLSSNVVRSLSEDSEGNIWFGTWRGGACRFDGQSFTHFTNKEGLSSNYILSTLEDSKGNIWFGTSGGGVSLYDGENFVHFTKKEGLSSNSVWSIIEDVKGNLWFGTNGGGVSRYDGEIFTHFTNKEGLNSNTVWSTFEDSKGNLWFGTFGGGVSCYDGKNFTHFTEKEGLSNNYIWSIIEDSKGNIWFITSGGGVTRHDWRSFTFFTKKNGLSSNTVRSILEDNKGNLWFGTWDGGVTCYNGENFTHFTEKEGLSDNTVRSLIEDSKGNIWLATDGGVSCYDGESFTHFTKKEGLSSNSVWSLLEDSKENLWFGTDGGGVSRYDGESFTHFTKKEGLSNNIGYSLLEDRKGSIWLTTGSGVSRYDGEYFAHFTEREGLTSNDVFSVLEDSKGNIWYGIFSSGASCYDGNSFTHFTEKEGLSNNDITSVLEDNKGNIWLGSEKGLTLLEGKQSFHLGSLDDKIKKRKPSTYNLNIKKFIKQDGLKGLDFFNNSAIMDSKNRAWWGTGKGLTMLDLNNFELSQNSPTVYLKQIGINEQFIDYRNISDSLSNEIQFSGVERFENYPHELKLPYDQNHLTFHFVGIDWSAPHKIQYSHRILGLNKNWSKPSDEAKADYRNLPHGTYTFQIRAIGESGEWSESFDYTFTIHPPWWHAIYARAGYGILGVLLILGTVKWRTKKLKKRQVELETEVDNATKEIREQKEVVEEKNREITDSITYAKRIQSAILPPKKLIREYLPESFILYKPKDIVAGDFYWMEQVKDTILFAAADCTGHGVPGAMVSVICNNGLNRSVREYGLKDPGKILDKTRDVVISEFEKSEEDVKDGMDISLCKLDFNNQTLQWAGANNPLWIIRNNEVLVTKPNKQAIGKVDNPEPFITHEINLQKGDTIYIFTDGYPDQFGGEKGKKYKSANFKKLLLDIYNKNMDDQKLHINREFESWKGDLEQVDDVCVIGVRL